MCYKINALILYNPYSGRGFNLCLEEVIEELKSYGFSDVSVFYPNYKGEIRAYLNLNLLRFELLVVFGGDGTLHEVLNGIAGSPKRPKILFIPNGTANDFSSGFNLSKNYKTSFRLIKEETTKIDIIKIDNEYFIYVLGCGKFTSISYDARFYFLKKRIGRLYYFIQAVKGLFLSSDLNLEITIKNRKINGKYFLFLILNTPRVAGFKIKNNFSVIDGKASLYLFRKTLFPIIVLFCFLFLNIKLMVEEYVFEKINIKSRGKLILNLDGERVESSKDINISVLKEEIEFYLPLNSELINKKSK